MNETHLDSHADTCAGGANFSLLDPSNIDGYVDVSPFSDEYLPLQDVPIATCVTAWTDPNSGNVYLLVFGQMLYFGPRLPHSLLCPNQLQDHGLVVEDTPRQFDTRSSHSITVPRESGTDLIIPLNLTGVISYFESRVPTETELAECDFVWMTSQSPWKPHSDRFQTDESAVSSDLGSSLHIHRLQSICTRDIPECLSLIHI